MNDPTFIGEKSKQIKDLFQIREDFPILAEQVNGKPLAYLDNAASSQMPKAVIDRVSTYHLSEHSNIHRAVHLLSERATAEYEDARIKVKDLIGARSEKEIIFTKGTTNGINMVAQGYGRKFLKAGDEILITHLEHHSNIVPWQLLCEQLGVKLKVAPIDNAGDVDIIEYEKLLSEKTKFVALSHVSNALGTVLPIRKMIRSAHAVGAPVLIDGAQAVPHMEVDVQELDCDFYVFSGHKMCGPSGIGALYGRGELLEEMHPYEGGGDMILSVSFDKTAFLTSLKRARLQ